MQKTSLIAGPHRMDVVLTYYRALGCGSVVMKPTFRATYSDLNAHCIVQQGRGQFVKSFIYQELLVIKDNTWLTILCLHGGRFLIISYIYRIPTTPPNLKDWYITYVPVQLCMRVRFSVNNKWLCVYDVFMINLRIFLIYTKPWWKIRGGALCVLQ